jgi:hypothetical protein
MSRLLLSKKMKLSPNVLQYRPLIVIGLLFVLSVAPVFLVDIPAMVDYVNHLARMHLLVDATLGRTNPAYQIEWRLYPNLAMDIVVPLLARTMSVECASRFFLLTSQTVVISGALALEMAVCRRCAVAALVALMTLYSLPFLWGLMNFEFGTGIALWGSAAWIYFRDRSLTLRLAVHSLFVLSLFVTHFFALGIYGLTIGLYEASRFSVICRALQTYLMMAAPVAALYFILLWSGGAIGKPVFDWWLGLKLLWPALIMNAYSVPLSALLAAIIVSLIIYVGRVGAIQLTPAARWIGSGFLIVYLLMPGRLFDSAYGDVRLITAAALIIPSFLVISWPSRRVQAVATIVSIGVIVVNAATVLSVWVPYQKDYNEIIASFRVLRRHSIILIGRADASKSADSPMYYAPTLAAHYAASFVPSLYTLAGEQPIRKSEAFKHFEMADSLDYLPTQVSELSAVAAGNIDGAPLHVRNWLLDYDYLYVIGERTADVPDQLTEIVRGHRFTLYEIRK